MAIRFSARCLLPVIGLLALAACGGRSSESSGAAGGYDVTVTRTALGIPHIKAANFGSMGYGYGYAFAEDNLCVMYDDFLTIRGERSKYIGPDGSYTIRAASTTTDNLSSDFFWKLLATDAVIDNLKLKALPELREATSGYAAGFNRYIRELKAGQHAGRHAACRNQPYLQEISEADMYRRYFRLSVIASSTVFSAGIGSAQPPSASNPTGPVLSRAQLQQAFAETPDALAFFKPDRPFGSNMYGIGKDGSATGVPMLFGNPERHRAALHRPRHHPGSARHHGLQPLRRAGGADRIQRQAGLESHGFHRLPLHALPVGDQPGQSDPVPV